MDFSHPIFLYIALSFLIIFPIAALLMVWQRGKDIKRFGSPEAFRRLTEHLSSLRRTLKLGLMMLGLLFITLALAGPQWGSKMVEVKRKGVDVFIALDISRSMLAEDVKPNRLQRAQQELTALIDQLKGDRVGIIAFAGNAQVACPLTTDYSAAKMFLNYLTPDSITIPGTSLGEAIQAAIANFPKGSEGSRVLVLLTDGEDHHSNPEQAAKMAKESGVRILSIGFGTANGEPLPLRDETGRVSGYMKDAQGKTVVSKLDEGMLKQITQITDGAYWPAAAGSLEVERMAELIGQMQKKDISAGQYGTYEERFQFLLLPGILLMLASLWLPIRKQAWLVIVPLLLLGNSYSGWADVGSDINKGNRLFEKQKYEQALQRYEDAQIKRPESPVVQYNLGNALHKLKRFEESDAAYRRAVKTKDVEIKAKTFYNLGNNYLQQQKFTEAIEQYRVALKWNPKDKEALHNLAMALRYMKKPPEKKQSPPQQQPKDGQSQQGQDKSKADKSQSEKQQSQGSDALKKSQGSKGPDDKGEQKSDKQEDGPNDSGEEKPNASGEKKAPKPGEMSEKEAEQLLDAVRDAEQEAQRKRLSGAQDKGRKGQSSAAEDW